MSFKHLKTASLMFLAAVLTACGGGGGSGNDSGFNPPGVNAAATASQASIPAGSSTDISVRITEANGAAVRDGVVVTGSVNPSSVGSIFGLNAAGAITQGNTAPTAGGNANFRFIGENPGTATVSFTAADPNTAGRTVTTSVTVTVTPGQPRISIQATKTRIPINTYNIEPFIGSPYMAEVIITVRDSAGNPINDPAGVQVSLNPVGVTGGYSTLDDPATEDVNEFFVRMGQGPVNVIAGKATVFVHSFNLTGTSVLTASMQDPVTGQTFSAQETFHFVATLPPGAEDVVVTNATPAVYVQGSGGNSNAQIEVVVMDGIGQPIGDPQAGANAFNNIRAEIVSDAADPGRLVAVNAAGQQVTGTSIVLRTNSGIGNITYRAGATPGLVRIRVTADRADNNVDNGIQDPVIGHIDVAVSDGVLFDLQLTSPTVNALTINPFDPNVERPDSDELFIPANPDGTYSLTISVIAQDRLGNPVLPGTVINFGLIDEPQATGAADFIHRGNDGRPQVAGTNFTAPSGEFLTRGGGVGPGDTLVVFGKREGPMPFGLQPPPEGYRDLESARQIARVNSQTSLDVTRRFNHNDDAQRGVPSPVPAPGLLPWVIGRAADGNITASATTNEMGVATVQMNYPMSRLGKLVVVWAQGNGDIVGGSPETVTDADLFVFAGVAPGRMVVSPSAIPANTTSAVTVCIFDALGVGVANIPISASFVDLDGNGSISFPGGNAATGAGGCVTAQVTTSAVAATGQPRVVFSGAGLTDSVDIVRGALVLQAAPSTMFGSGTITLTLRNAGGQPQPGYQIVGTCTGDAPTTLTIVSGPGVTDAQGRTTVDVVEHLLNRVGAAGSGSCTFGTTDGSATVTVPFQGVDVCTLGLSPPHPGCPLGPQASLTVSASGALAATVTSSPSGIAFSKPAGVTQNQNASFAQGSTVTLVVTPANNNPASVTFTGDCVRQADLTASAVASVSMAATRTCSVTVN